MIMGHDFTLALLGETEVTEELTKKVYKAGCTDATVCCRGGRVLLDFTRDATSKREALSSAMKDLRQAGFHTAFVLIERDVEE